MNTPRVDTEGKILFPKGILTQLREIAAIGNRHGLISGWQLAAAMVAELDHLPYWAGRDDGVGSIQIEPKPDRNRVAEIIRGAEAYDRYRNPHAKRALSLARQRAPLAEILPVLLEAQRWWGEHE
jgi:hypothetical protein